MNSYVMSHFSGHSILTALTMAVLIVSGVLRLTIAKFIDEFGRAHGFVVAAGLSILGLIIQAAAQSLVTTIVALLLFGIGWSCLDYVLSIVLADMTSLKNRGTLFSLLTCVHYARCKVIPDAVKRIQRYCLSENSSTSFPL